jgi:hypothetical protein
MRGVRPVIVAVGLLVAVSAATPVAQARTLVDPTSLTPPLKPFRICYELGPYVQCDTSGDVVIENEPTDDSPCGLIDQSVEEKSHSTRWYQDGLIVRRQVQEHDDGTWSLSPTGDGPTVAFSKDASWDELFSAPGDITSGVTTVRGATLRVPALGVELREAGLFLVNGDHVGLFTSFDEIATDELCALLVG